MNFVERIAKWVGVDVDAVNRPELIQFRLTMDAARAHKRAEAFPQAIAAFQRASDLCEQLGDVMGLSVVRLHLADIYTKLHEFDEAQTYINRVLRSGDGVYPTAPRAYAKVAQGVLDMARGEDDTARSTLEDAANSAAKANSPGAEGRALGHLAATYMRESNASYAVHLLRIAIDKLNMAGDIELMTSFFIALAEALIATGDTQEADHFLSRAHRMAEQLKSRGDLRRVNLVLAKRALATGQYAESYNAYEKALQYTDETAPERAAALRDLATAGLYLDKREDALVYAERAVSITPDDAGLRGTLGTILQSMGRSEEALPHLRAAILAPEPDYDTLRAMAAAYGEIGRPDSALKTLETTLELARRADLPLEQARTLRDIGHLHQREQRTAEAIKAWQQAYDLYERQNVAAQTARLLCDLANARISTGNMTRAFRDYEQALMLINNADDPATRGVVLSNAATIYVERGDLETAEAFFTESIQIAQKTHDAAAEATRRGNFGWFLLNTGRYERAKTALQFAVELSERLNLRTQVAVQTSNLAQTTSALGDDAAAEKLHLRALAAADVAGVPRWQALIRSFYSQWLTEHNRHTEARALLDEAQPLATHDTEASARVALEQARATIPLDAAHAATDSYRLVNSMRPRGNKRLLADALTVLSQALGVQGRRDEARTAWIEAAKLYTELEHPLKNQQPAWLGEG